MKTLISTLVIVIAMLMCSSTLMAQAQRVSPHETISARIGSGRPAPLVTLTYGRPYSKDPRGNSVRKIWGTLVPWEKAWRMGSDEATTLITQQPLAFGDVTVPPGAYTLYMVPSESGTSKMAISKKIGQWGIPVDETQDLARVDLKKEPMEKQLDQFTMTVENNPAGGGVIKMMWENTQFSVPFTIKN